MPCAVTLWTFLLIPSFLGTAVIGRLLVFYLLSQYSRAVAAMHERLTFNTGSSLVAYETTPASKLSLQYFDFFVTFAYFVCNGSNAIDPKLTPEKRDTVLAILKFLVTSRGRINLLFFISLPFLIIIAVIMANDPAYIAGCGGCTQDKTGIILGTMIAICCVQVLFGMLIAWQSRKWPDRWGQGRESRWLVFFSILGFFCFIADAFSDLSTQTFDLSILVGTCFMANQAVCTVVQVYIAVKKEAALSKTIRRGSDALSSLATSQIAAPVGIDAVLADKQLLAAFENHLVEELGPESLLFIQDLAAWKSHYYDSGAASRTVRARKIVASYLSPSGNYSINVSSDVLENIMKQSKLPDAPFTMFDEADEEIRRLLNRGAYQRFLAKRSGAQVMV